LSWRWLDLYLTAPLAVAGALSGAFVAQALCVAFFRAI